MSSARPADLQREIARSAAFRLTLRFAGIFVVCLLAIDLAAGLGARWLVQRQTLATLERTLVELQSAMATGEPEVAAAAARRLARDEEDRGVLIGWQDAEGALLEGDLALAAPLLQLGVHVPDGEDPDEGYWLRSAQLPRGGWVSAAMSMETYHDIGEFMLAGAIWTVVIASPLALLSGALLSRAVVGRLSGIAATAEGVRDGALSHRAPVSPRGDEFDRLAMALNAMLDTIESLTRNLRNVSVGIAHELRGPLTRVRNRLIDIDASRPAAVEASIDSAIAEIDATLVTFDALLKIGQIEARRQGRGFGPVDLSDLLAELTEIYAPVAADQAKRLDARIAAEVVLSGDRPLLTQMICNLLENAIQHTPAGTQILVELQGKPGVPRLIVEDDGPGVPAAETERVFERFYRLERGSARMGSGLGLSLVRSICGLHGFAIRLDPQPVGARFEITLTGLK